MVLRNHPGKEREEPKSTKTMVAFFVRCNPRMIERFSLHQAVSG
jgi:hypothetical protein